MATNTQNNKPIADYKRININERQRALEILGHPPSWMIKWGITLFFIVISVFIGISFFIKYPDSIDASTVIRTELPSLPLVSKSGGALDSIVVMNNDVVREGDLIAVIGTTVEYRHIVKVRRALQSLTEENQVSIPETLDFSDIPHLGPLNEEYLALINAYASYRALRESLKAQVAIQSSKNEMHQIRELRGFVEEEISLYDREIKYLDKNLERGSDLHAQGLMSEVELEKLLTESTSKDRQLSSLRSSITRNNLREDQLQSAIEQTEIEHREQVSQAQIQLEGQVRRLNSSIHLWMDEHLITAPGSGIISFAKDWRQNQLLSPMDIFGMVVPTESENEILAYCSLPLKGAGKIKSGHKVNIKLHAFPYQQFGTIPTVISEMPLIPYDHTSTEPVYEIIMSLGDSMITNYNIQLPFTQELTGVATIITEDRSIFHRIFSQVMSAMNN